MEEHCATTLEKIQQAARAEFLEKGFLGASLRQIVKNAGVTTGAFYGYFSSKTCYQHFVHNMVEVEVEATLQYMQVLRRLGRDVPELDGQLCHILASGMFNGIFEVVVHDMPRDKAMQYVDQLRDFYTAGGRKLMGG